MKNELFEAVNTNDAVFFRDTLTEEKPYIASLPRNHESLCFVTDGTLYYEKQGKTQLIHTGQIAYIARGSIDTSGAHQCPSVSYIAVNFNFDRHSAEPSQSLPFDTLCCKTPLYQAEELFKTALDEYSSANPGSQIICSGILRQIIGLIYNNHILGKSGKSKIKKIENALKYLKENYSRADLKISTLAQIENMSEKHFRRLFFEIYNKNPYEFLRDYRLTKAKVMLLDSSKQISDIAIDCGFSDVYSFSHCFKSAFGIPPKTYKEQMK